MLRITEGICELEIILFTKVKIISQLFFNKIKEFEPHSAFSEMFAESNVSPPSEDIRSRSIFDFTHSLAK